MDMPETNVAVAAVSQLRQHLLAKLREHPCLPATHLGRAGV